MIPYKQYKKIIGSVPILTIDLLIKKGNKYLLVKRNKEPLRGKYWVPGGRVLRGEKISGAVRRKTLEEVGLKVKSMKFIKYFNQVFKHNEFELDFIHTVSLVFEITCTGKIRLDNQSSDYKWSTKLPI